MDYRQQSCRLGRLSLVRSHQEGNVPWPWSEPGGAAHGNGLQLNDVSSESPWGMKTSSFTEHVFPGLQGGQRGSPAWGWTCWRRQQDGEGSSHLKGAVAFHAARANPVRSLPRRGEALGLHKRSPSALTFRCPSQASPSEVLSSPQRTALQLEIT